MYAVILAMTVAQFATVSVAQGQIDPVKHTFLFNVLADICLVGALIELGTRLRRSTLPATKSSTTESRIKSPNNSILPQATGSK